LCSAIRSRSSPQKRGQDEQAPLLRHQPQGVAGDRVQAHRVGDTADRGLRFVAPVDRGGNQVAQVGTVGHCGFERGDIRLKRIERPAFLSQFKHRGRISRGDAGRDRSRFAHVHPFTCSPGRCERSSYGWPGRCLAAPPGFSNSRLGGGRQPVPR
jgi:hypothetical protein